MWRWLTAVAVACGVWLGVAAPSAAAKGTGYSVTFAARECQSYGDIFANRFRDNLMQTLHDVGPDSPYGPNDLVNPSFEDTDPQTNCTPLTGWEFTMGRQPDLPPLAGPWGSLTVVNGAFPPVTTKAQTAELNENGKPTGLKIAGATTFELTQEQLDVANQGQWALRLQGGTPTDPVLAQKFFESVPGDPRYAFGALRCGNDNNYGDNVEGISFPGGIKHIFCYEYLVIPPPTSGTITIQKQVSGAPAGDNPYFPFNGNISYDVNGFQLANGGSMVFYRAGGETWSVTEGAVANYRLDRIDCTSSTRTSTFTVSGSTAQIHLAAGDHATCVYHNAYVPPPGGLTIRKVTRGGVGTFSYAVTAFAEPGRGPPGAGDHHATKGSGRRGPLAAQPGAGPLRDRRAEANVARRALAPAPRELQRREPVDDQAVRRRDPQRPISRLHVRQQLRSARLDLDREDHRGWRWHRLLRGHAGDGAADAAPPERDHDKPGGGGRGQAADPRRRHRQPSPRHLSHRRTAAPQLHRRLGPDHGRVQRSGDPLRPRDGEHRADPQGPRRPLRVHQRLLRDTAGPPEPDAGPPDASPRPDARPRL